MNERFYTLCKIEESDDIRLMEVSGSLRIEHIRIENPVFAIETQKQLYLLQTSVRIFILTFCNWA